MTAHAYAELIDRLLSSCRYLDRPTHVRSQIRIPAHNPLAFEWKDTIQLIDGLHLKVVDYAIFSSEGGMVERNFSYDLREAQTGKLIWRICNHGGWKIVDEPCHVHANRNDESERKEIWPSSKEQTFPYVMRCIKNHYERKPQEWEAHDQ